MSHTDEATRDVFETRQRGLSHLGVRRANAKTVLTVVAFNSGASNAEISRLSGLAPQTVSAILIELENDGLIHRGEALRGKRGQPATPILLNAEGGLSVGVEIGWRHLEVALINMHATVLERHHADYAYPDAETIVEAIGTLVDAFVANLPARHRTRLLDLGVAMPGRLAEHLDLLDAPPEQAIRWRELDLAARLEARTGLVVSLFNDGNAGCWAELIALRAPRPANIVYMLVSHYIAAGIVGDGALWEGATGNAAELGSILVSVAGAPPRPAHEVASLWAMHRHGERTENPHPDPSAQWVGQAADALAQVIFNAMTVVERPVVILDTALGRDKTAALIRRVEEKLAGLPLRSRIPRIVQGQLGSLAPAIGAAELPLFRRYF